MSIWKGKNNYKSTDVFIARTKKVLKKTPETKEFKIDIGPIQPRNPAANWLMEEIGRFNNPSVLEIGCGYGRWAPKLADLCSSYTGVDIVKDRINYAKKNNQTTSNIKFVHINENDWDLGETYDVIFTVTVIQHLTMPSTINLLNRISRHLKQNGAALLFEARLEHCTEQEAEEKYMDDGCEIHMIYKPIGVLEKKVPSLVWEKKNGLKHILRKK